MALLISFFIAYNTSPFTATDLYVLKRSPKKVYSMQPVLVFAKVVKPAEEILLRVNIEVVVSIKPEETISLPPSLSVSYSLRMIPLPWTREWYVALIPGLISETFTIRYEALPGIAAEAEIKLSSRVEYKLLVDGVEVAEGEYEVLEGEITRRVPPIIISMVRHALEDVEVMKETYGLGPRGWVLGAGMPLEVVLIAFDDRGIKKINLEYSVCSGAWKQAELRKDPYMDLIGKLLEDVNEFLGKVESIIRTIKPDFTLPRVKCPFSVVNAIIPAQKAGVYVLFRGRAIDVDGNEQFSPIGLYYVVNAESKVRILIIDPHVWIWLFQRNCKEFGDAIRRYMEYEIPEEILGNLTIIKEIADMILKYGITPFHHWELLGKHYNLYITWPDERIKESLKECDRGRI